MKAAGHADIPEWELLVDDAGRVTFAHPAQARAYLRAKFAGQCIVGQFYEQREKRSGKQNRGFHVMVKPWALERGWPVEALKQFLLGRVFGWLELVDESSGEVVKVLAEPHTSKLTVGQFCELIDRTLELAAEDGVILIAPDEFRRQREAAARKAARDARKGAA